MKKLVATLVLSLLFACSGSSEREPEEEPVGEASDFGRVCSSGCDVVCLGRRYCTDFCTSDADCPTNFACTGTDDEENRLCEKTESNPPIGRSCVTGCGEDVCVDDGLESYCSTECASDDACPDDFACRIDTTVERERCFKVRDVQPPEFAFLYDLPADGSVVTIDQPEILLTWIGGRAPYEVRFGSDPENLPSFRTVNSTSMVIDLDLVELETDTTYYWAVVDGVGTESATLHEVQSFVTTSRHYPFEDCPGEARIAHGGRAYHAVLVGETCWMTENLVIGNRATTRTHDDGVIEKFCQPIIDDDCTFDALYTAWEVYQDYPDDVTSLSGVAICPPGWSLPTAADFDELIGYVGVGGLLSDNAVGFKLIDARTPRSDELQLCDDGSGGQIACTDVLELRSRVNETYLWLDGTDGTITQRGHPYIVLRYANREWMVSPGIRSASHAHSVRCVRR